ncbi:MAG: MBL fold metallo-hydrolase [Firmicutes bacterium]|nr:MBL fold metallo-hydrolase [Bacillota bacterium]
MKITFLGAARTVTGSCYLLEHNNCRFLVDCGMFQGNKALKNNNYTDFPFNPGEIDFVLLTHAHIDHSGLLPKLYKQGFKNPIYSSTATVALLEIMLPDSGYIQEQEVERKNRKLMRAGARELEPIYTAADALATLPLCKGVRYGEEFSPAEGIRVVYQDAGHIFGSAMLEIYFEENGVQRKLVFTGDLGRNDQAIVRDPYIMESADYLVMESTYGNRLHGGDAEKEIPLFAEVITRTVYRGGNVIIPAFAVDRTQDILYLLNEMQLNKMIPECTVYVDSPLAIKATEIFARFPDYYDRMTAHLFKEEGRPPFVLKNLIYTASAAESQQLNNVKSGAIIISASGMADAGRIKHHLKHNLWRKECSVLFFGYQAEGTLGRRLIEGEKKVTIHGEEVEVKADIYNMEGFSAHADHDELLAWMKGFKQLPRRVFVTHGEEQSALDWAAEVGRTFGVEAIAPEYGYSYDFASATAQAGAVQPALPVTAAAPAADTPAAEAHTLDAELLLEINADIQRIMASRDVDKLIRLRDYLHSIS